MRVCIVGNGEVALKSKHKSFIDNSEVVIRMGSYVTEGFEDFVGSKTDIIASGTSLLKFWKNIKRITRDDVVVWGMNPVFSSKTIEGLTNHSKYLLKFCNEWLKQMYGKNQPSLQEHENNLQILKRFTSFGSIDWQDVVNLIDKLGYPKISVLNNDLGELIRPTLGMFVLEKVMKDFPDYEIYLKGFDFSNSYWYWDTTPRVRSKNFPILERVLCRKYERNQILTFL